MKEGEFYKKRIIALLDKIGVDYLKIIYSMLEHRTKDEGSK